MLRQNNDSNLKAILGPTNTGKTYLAFERLLSYQSGIFGFPLRLLARENYDKAVKKIGLEKVALITGEEKIFPKTAKYFFCTVESMPTNINVDCVAIDEIQLASDYERGHIYTDRILYSRGSYETILLGSLTIELILKKIFPKIQIEKRDRFSKLTFNNKKNISKLKPRTAIIAFNINKVYEIAETLKMHKGGAAVVLGSLSPRTRNAQVEVYESKKVDYLVSTDAIGMGLNLNINHVCFSSFQKFDGRFIRNLYPSEIGQIAGRAGRYQNDGTFGYTRDAGNLDPLIIKSIEDHNFNSINKIFWRNSKIDFSSISSVLNSLKKFPIKDFYIHKKNALDEINFRILLKDKYIEQYLTNSFNIKLLWDVCRIPDFKKILNENYLDLLKKIFSSLMENDLKIPEDILINQTKPLENYSGGIEELTSKISSIRTWTYISNQSSWIENNNFWQEKTRNIEDNLSDYLHESLINRFVDFSASFFIDMKKNGLDPHIKIDSDKLIKLNGQNYGYINGFDLKLFDKSKTESIFFHKNAQRTIRTMIEEKIIDFIKAPDDSLNLGDITKLKLDDEIKIYWGDEAIGLLKKGKNIFSPVTETLNSNFLDSDKKNEITNKLQNWIVNKISETLKPAKDDFDNLIPSELRKILFNLFESHGMMEIEKYKSTIKNLTTENKTAISKMGIRIGAKYFFLPNFLKKNAMELNALLWKIFNKFSNSDFFPLPKDGRVAFNTKTKLPPSYWSAIGYVLIDDYAVRVDVFEKVFFFARQKIKSGPFLESSELMNPIGCDSTSLSKVLHFCGFDNIIMGNEKKIFFIKLDNIKKVKKTYNKKIKTNTTKTPKILNKRKKKKIEADPNSPFAVLQKLL